MNSSFLAVLNSLFHSRKFQAYLIAMSIAILVPVVNKVGGLQLDPTILTGLVVSSVLGGAAYGVATGIEDGHKAQASATAAATMVQAAVNSPRDTGEELSAIQGIGGFGSIGNILGGSVGQLGITVLVSQLLSKIKGEKNQEKAAGIAADVVNQILAQYGNNDTFLKKTGLGH